MHRELGDERDRYGRRSLRERVEDALAWPGGHRFATGVILVVIAGALLLSVARGRTTSLRDLAVGDCLYVPTAAALDPSSPRPIGEAAAVEEVILTAGAQEAACTASHGHEVAAILTSPEPTVQTGVLGQALDRDLIRREAQPQCDAAFEGYVGHPLAGSRYVTFPVAPEPQAWLDGGRKTVCLVARADGGWMDHPARGSAE
jgi:hypothetical protein